MVQKNKQQPKKKKIIRMLYFVVYTWLVQKMRNRVFFIMLTNAKSLIPHSDRRKRRAIMSKQKTKTIVVGFVWRNDNFLHINYTHRVLNELDNVSKCRWILKTATDTTSSLIRWFCFKRLWLINLRMIKVDWYSGLNCLNLNCARLQWYTNWNERLNKWVCAYVCV